MRRLQITATLIRSPCRLAYPYKKDSTEYKDLSPETKTYVLANKWNGMNILFYKYSDASGREYVTAKSKGSPFITDSAPRSLHRVFTAHNRLSVQLPLVRSSPTH